MMGNGNVTLGVGCHPNIITAHRSPPVALKVPGCWEHTGGGIVVEPLRGVSEVFALLICKRPSEPDLHAS
jgi:hypothetical protein